MDYIGTITKILDKDLYTIEVDVPGYQVGLKAFPKRGEVDEPRVGDTVVLKEFDPVYHSYYLYEKLKENEFIGIRSRGKIIKITEDSIDIGIFTEGSYYDDNTGKSSTPSLDAWVKIDKSGNIEVNAGNSNVTLSGDSTVKISGNATVEVSGKTEAKLMGGANIKAFGNVTLGGSGQLKVSGSCIPNGKPGPFWGGGPVVPAPGSPAGSDTIILG